MKAVLLLVLLAVGAMADTPAPHMNCMPSIDWAFWDLKSLQALNDTDFVSTFNEDLNSDKISFSLCQPAFTKCRNETSHAIYERPDKPCRKLTGLSPANVNFTFLSTKNRSEGIKISFDGGDAEHNLTILLKCSNTTKIENYRRTDGDRAFEFTMYSPAGCPSLDVKPIMNFITGEAWVLKVVLMVAGLLLTFLGRQLVKPALFTLGFGSVFVTSTYIISSYFIDATTAPWTLYTLLGVGIVAAALVGYLAVKLEAVGFFSVGLALGYAFGNFMMLSVLIHTSIPNPAYVKYGIMAISGIVFGFAMVKFRDALMIIATSLFGALMVSRTFLATVTYLPSEPEILDMFQKGITIPHIVWGYLALYVVLAGLGIWVQKNRKSTESESKDFIPVNQGPYSYYQRA